MLVISLGQSLYWLKKCSYIVMNGLHIILRGFCVSCPCNLVQSLFNLLLKVVSDLVVSVILEWKNLYIDMRSSTSINILSDHLKAYSIVIALKTLNMK